MSPSRRARWRLPVAGGNTCGSTRASKSLRRWSQPSPEVLDGHSPDQSGRRRSRAVDLRGRRRPADLTEQALPQVADVLPVVKRCSCRYGFGEPRDRADSGRLERPPPATAGSPTGHVDARHRRERPGIGGDDGDTAHCGFDGGSRHPLDVARDEHDVGGMKHGQHIRDVAEEHDPSRPQGRRLALGERAFGSVAGDHQHVALGAADRLDGEVDALLRRSDCRGRRRPADRRQPEAGAGCLPLARRPAVGRRRRGGRWG